MTDEQRVQIINLREAGNGYKKIGQLLGLNIPAPFEPPVRTLRAIIPVPQSQ